MKEDAVGRQATACCDYPGSRPVVAEQTTPSLPPKQTNNMPHEWKKLRYKFVSYQNNLKCKERPIVIMEVSNFDILFKYLYYNYKKYPLSPLKPRFLVLIEQYLPNISDPVYSEHQ